MGLTQAQRAIIEKAKSVGGGEMGVTLSESVCAFLVATIARDLEVAGSFPELPGEVPGFFSAIHPEELVLHGLDFSGLFERLVSIVPDADTYFSCLASLHKSRLKYVRILECQPLPTMDQVGPRSLLQYGLMSPKALGVLLLWRKWVFDIDNRAGQETGYLFEPIIAHSIGGVPVGARRSPIRRKGRSRKGRQVDCIREKHAYEIKIRVTIAASGQGRWQEELGFPADCRHSGYTPVLVVLDPTPNPKLGELADAFRSEGGQVYVGAEAWAHLEQAAGKTMGSFLERYVRRPIHDVLAHVPAELPTIAFEMGDGNLWITAGGERYSFRRTPNPSLDEGGAELPEDIDEESAGL